MTELKCKNGDAIRVGGVYVFRGVDGEKVVACESQDNNHIKCGTTRYIKNFLARELPRDEDGYYIWEGGECPVPDDWIVDGLYQSSKGRNSAKHFVWSHIEAFRVVSTGEKFTPDYAEGPFAGDGLVFEEADASHRHTVKTELPPVKWGAVQSPEIHIANTPHGYEGMAAVLVRALEQSACGKGKERHAQDRPFEDQPMQHLIALNGVGFATGQVGKKCQEALRLPHDAAIRELLGAIVYAAGAIIYMENNRDEQS